MKRTFDIVMSALGLIVLSPLLTAIAMAVFLQDRQSPLFTQWRCGRGSSRFLLIKFRTMTDGEHIIKDYARDGRVTPVGRILRRYHLDEMPNLINILKGDMSFVGPRPMPYRVDQELDPGYINTRLIPGWCMRNSVRPGVTGYAQLNCPKMAPRQCKFEYDNIYVRNYSFRFDMILIVQTLKLILKRLLAIRLIFSPVSLVLLLLAVSGIVMALDECSNILDARSLIPDSVGAIAFASFGFGCLLLFVLVGFHQRGK